MARGMRGGQTNISDPLSTASFTCRVAVLYELRTSTADMGIVLTGPRAL